jgi:hypothetical protein
MKQMVLKLYEAALFKKFATTNQKFSRFRHWSEWAIIDYRRTRG